MANPLNPFAEAVSKLELKPLDYSKYDPTTQALFTGEMPDDNSDNGLGYIDPATGMSGRDILTQLYQSKGQQFTEPQSEIPAVNLPPQGEQTNAVPQDPNNVQTLKGQNKKNTNFVDSDNLADDARKGNKIEFPTEEEYVKQKLAVNPDDDEMVLRERYNKQKEVLQKQMDIKANADYVIKYTDMGDGEARRVRGGGEQSGFEKNTSQQEYVYQDGKRYVKGDNGKLYIADIPKPVQMYSEAYGIKGSANEVLGTSYYTRNKAKFNEDYNRLGVKKNFGNLSDEEVADGRLVYQKKVFKPAEYYEDGKLKTPSRYEYDYFDLKDFNQVNFAGQPIIVDPKTGQQFIAVIDTDAKTGEPIWTAVDAEGAIAATKLRGTYGPAKKYDSNVQIYDAFANGLRTNLTMLGSGYATLGEFFGNDEMKRAGNKWANYHNANAYKIGENNQGLNWSFGAMSRLAANFAGQIAPTMGVGLLARGATVAAGAAINSARVISAAPTVAKHASFLTSAMQAAHSFDDEAKQAGINDSDRKWLYILGGASVFASEKILSGFGGLLDDIGGAVNSTALGQKVQQRLWANATKEAIAKYAPALKAATTEQAKKGIMSKMADYGTQAFIKVMNGVKNGQESSSRLVRAIAAGFEEGLEETTEQLTNNLIKATYDKFVAHADATYGKGKFGTTFQDVFEGIGESMAGGFLGGSLMGGIFSRAPYKDVSKAYVTAQIVGNAKEWKDVENWANNAWAEGEFDNMFLDKDNQLIYPNEYGKKKSKNDLVKESFLAELKTMWDVKERFGLKGNQAVDKLNTVFGGDERLMHQTLTGFKLIEDDKAKLQELYKSADLIRKSENPSTDQIAEADKIEKEAAELHKAIYGDAYTEKAQQLQKERDNANKVKLSSNGIEVTSTQEEWLQQQQKQLSVQQERLKEMEASKNLMYKLQRGEINNKIQALKGEIEQTKKGISNTQKQIDALGKYDAAIKEHQSLDQKAYNEKNLQAGSKMADLNYVTSGKAYNDYLASQSLRVGNELTNEARGTNTELTHEQAEERITNARNKAKEIEQASQFPTGQYQAFQNAITESNDAFDKVDKEKLKDIFSFEEDEVEETAETKIDEESEQYKAIMAGKQKLEQLKSVASNYTTDQVPVQLQADIKALQDKYDALIQQLKQSAQEKAGNKYQLTNDDFTNVVFENTPFQYSKLSLFIIGKEENAIPVILNESDFKNNELELPNNQGKIIEKDGKYTFESTTNKNGNTVTEKQPVVKEEMNSSSFPILREIQLLSLNISSAERWKNIETGGMPSDAIQKVQEWQDQIQKLKNVLQDMLTIGNTFTNNKEQIKNDAEFTLITDKLSAPQNRGGIKWIIQNLLKAEMTVAKYEEFVKANGSQRAAATEKSNQMITHIYNMVFNGADESNLPDEKLNSRLKDANQPTSLLDIIREALPAEQKNKLDGFKSANNIEEAQQLINQLQLMFNSLPDKEKASVKSALLKLKEFVANRKKQTPDIYPNGAEKSLQASKDKKDSAQDKRFVSQYLLFVEKIINNILYGDAHEFQKQWSDTVKGISNPPSFEQKEMVRDAFVHLQTGIAGDLQKKTLIMNGPAGAGKTTYVLLPLLKMIEKQRGQKRVIILAPYGSQLEAMKEAADAAGIQNAVYATTEENPEEFKKLNIGKDDIVVVDEYTLIEDVLDLKEKESINFFLGDPYQVKISGMNPKGENYASPLTLVMRTNYNDLFDLQNTYRLIRAQYYKRQEERAQNIPPSPIVTDFQSLSTRYFLSDNDTQSNAGVRFSDTTDEVKAAFVDRLLMLKNSNNLSEKIMVAFLNEKHYQAEKQFIISALLKKDPSLTQEQANKLFEQTARVASKEINSTLKPLQGATVEEIYVLFHKGTDENIGKEDWDRYSSFELTAVTRAKNFVHISKEQKDMPAQANYYSAQVTSIDKLSKEALKTKEVLDGENAKYNKQEEELLKKLSVKPKAAKSTAGPTQQAQSSNNTAGKNEPKKDTKAEEYKKIKDDVEAEKVKFVKAVESQNTDDILSVGNSFLSFISESLSKLKELRDTQGIDVNLKKALSNTSTEYENLQASVLSEVKKAETAKQQADDFMQQPRNESPFEARTEKETATPEPEIKEEPKPAEESNQQQPESFENVQETITPKETVETNTEEVNADNISEQQVEMKDVFAFETPATNKEYFPIYNIPVVKFNGKLVSMESMRQSMLFNAKSLKTNDEVYLHVVTIKQYVRNTNNQTETTNEVVVASRSKNPPTVENGIIVTGAEHIIAVNNPSNTNEIGRKQTELLNKVKASDEVQKGKDKKEPFKMQHTNAQWIYVPAKKGTEINGEPESKNIDGSSVDFTNDTKEQIDNLSIDQLEINMKNEFGQSATIEKDDNGRLFIHTDEGDFKTFIKVKVMIGGLGQPGKINYVVKVPVKIMKLNSKSDAVQRYFDRLDNALNNSNGNDFERYSKGEKPEVHPVTLFFMQNKKEAQKTILSQPNPESDFSALGKLDENREFVFSQKGQDFNEFKNQAKKLLQLMKESGNQLFPVVQKQSQGILLAEPEFVLSTDLPKGESIKLGHLELKPIPTNNTRRRNKIQDTNVDGNDLITDIEAIAEMERLIGKSALTITKQPIYDENGLPVLGYVNEFGEVVLSSNESTKGIQFKTVSHEAMHVIVEFKLTTDARTKLYDEVFQLTGKQGVEASEWLSEEFERYNKERRAVKGISSFMRKFFDFFKFFMDNLFGRRKSLIETVFRKAADGHYANMPFQRLQMLDTYGNLYKRGEASKTFGKKNANFIARAKSKVAFALKDVLVSANLETAALENISNTNAGFDFKYMFNKLYPTVLKDVMPMLTAEEKASVQNGALINNVTFRNELKDRLGAFIPKVQMLNPEMTNVKIMNNLPISKLANMLSVNGELSIGEPYPGITVSKVFEAYALLNGNIFQEFLNEYFPNMSLADIQQLNDEELIKATSGRDDTINDKGADETDLMDKQSAMIKLILNTVPVNKDGIPVFKDNEIIAMLSDLHNAQFNSTFDELELQAQQNNWQAYKEAVGETVTDTDNELIAYDFKEANFDNPNAIMRIALRNIIMKHKESVTFETDNGEALPVPAEYDMAKKMYDSIYSIESGSTSHARIMYINELININPEMGKQAIVELRDAYNMQTKEEAASVDNILSRFNSLHKKSQAIYNGINSLLFSSNKNRYAKTDGISGKITELKPADVTEWSLKMMDNTNVLFLGDGNTAGKGYERMFFNDGSFQSESKSSEFKISVVGNDIKVQGRNNDNQLVDIITIDKDGKITVAKTDTANKIQFVKNALGLMGVKTNSYAIKVLAADIETQGMNYDKFQQIFARHIMAAYLGTAELRYKVNLTDEDFNYQYNQLQSDLSFKTAQIKEEATLKAVQEALQAHIKKGYGLGTTDGKVSLSKLNNAKEIDEQEESGVNNEDDKKYAPTAFGGDYDKLAELLVYLNGGSRQLFAYDTSGNKIYMITSNDTLASNYIGGKSKYLSKTKKITRYAKFRKLEGKSVEFSNPNFLYRENTDGEAVVTVHNPLMDEKLHQGDNNVINDRLFFNGVFNISDKAGTSLKAMTIADNWLAYAQFIKDALYDKDFSKGSYVQMHNANNRGRQSFLRVNFHDGTEERNGIFKKVITAKKEGSTENSELAMDSIGLMNMTNRRFAMLEQAQVGSFVRWKNAIQKIGGISSNAVLAQLNNFINLHNQYDSSNISYDTYKAARTAAYKALNEFIQSDVFAKSYTDKNLPLIKSLGLVNGKDYRVDTITIDGKSKKFFNLGLHTTMDNDLHLETISDKTAKPVKLTLKSPNNIFNYSKYNREFQFKTKENVLFNLSIGELVYLTSRNLDENLSYDKKIEQAIKTILANQNINQELEKSFLSDISKMILMDKKSGLFIENIKAEHKQVEREKLRNPRFMTENFNANKKIPFGLKDVKNPKEYDEVWAAISIAQVLTNDFHMEALLGGNHAYIKHGYKYVINSDDIKGEKHRATRYYDFQSNNNKRSSTPTTGGTKNVYDDSTGIGLLRNIMFKEIQTAAELKNITINRYENGQLVTVGVGQDKAEISIYDGQAFGNPFMSALVHRGLGTEVTGMPDSKGVRIGSELSTGVSFHNKQQLKELNNYEHSPAEYMMVARMNDLQGKGLPLSWLKGNIQFSDILTENQWNLNEATPFRLQVLLEEESRYTDFYNDKLKKIEKIETDNGTVLQYLSSVSSLMSLINWGKANNLHPRLNNLEQELKFRHRLYNAGIIDFNAINSRDKSLILELYLRKQYADNNLTDEVINAGIIAGIWNEQDGEMEMLEEKLFANTERNKSVLTNKMEVYNNFADIMQNNVYIPLASRVKAELDTDFSEETYQMVKAFQMGHSFQPSEARKSDDKGSELPYKTQANNFLKGGDIPATGAVSDILTVGDNFFTQSIRESEALRDYEPHIQIGNMNTDISRDEASPIVQLLNLILANPQNIAEQRTNAILSKTADIIILGLHKIRKEIVNRANKNNAGIQATLQAIDAQGTELEKAKSYIEQFEELSQKARQEALDNRTTTYTNYINARNAFTEYLKQMVASKAQHSSGNDILDELIQNKRVGLDNTGLQILAYRYLSSAITTDAIKARASGMRLIQAAGDDIPVFDVNINGKSLPMTEKDVLLHFRKMGWIDNRLALPLPLQKQESFLWNKYGDQNKKASWLKSIGIKPEFMNFAIAAIGQPRPLNSYEVIKQDGKEQMQKAEILVPAVLFKGFNIPSQTSFREIFNYYLRAENGNQVIDVYDLATADKRQELIEQLKVVMDYNNKESIEENPFLKKYIDNVPFKSDDESINPFDGVDEVQFNKDLEQMADVIIGVRAVTENFLPVRVPSDAGSAYLGTVIGFTNEHISTRIYAASKHIFIDGSDYDIDQITGYFKAVTDKVLGKDNTVQTSKDEGNNLYQMFIDVYSDVKATELTMMSLSTADGTRIADEVSQADAQKIHTISSSFEARKNAMLGAVVGPVANFQKLSTFLFTAYRANNGDESGINNKKRLFGGRFATRFASQNNNNQLKAFIAENGQNTNLGTDNSKIMYYGKINVGFGNIDFYNAAFGSAAIDDGTNGFSLANYVLEDAERFGISPEEKNTFNLITAFLLKSKAFNDISKKMEYNALYIRKSMPKRFYQSVYEQLKQLEKEAPEMRKMQKDINTQKLTSFSEAYNLMLDENKVKFLKAFENEIIIENGQMTFAENMNIDISKAWEFIRMLGNENKLVTATDKKSYKEFLEAVSAAVVNPEISEGTDNDVQNAYNDFQDEIQKYYENVNINKSLNQKGQLVKTVISKLRDYLNLSGTVLGDDQIAGFMDALSNSENDAEISNIFARTYSNDQVIYKIKSAITQQQIADRLEDKLSGTYRKDLEVMSLLGIKGEWNARMAKVVSINQGTNSESYDDQQYIRNLEFLTGVEYTEMMNLYNAYQKDQANNQLKITPLDWLESRGYKLSDGKPTEQMREQMRFREQSMKHARAQGDMDHLFVPYENTETNMKFSYLNEFHKMGNVMALLFSNPSTMEQIRAVHIAQEAETFTSLSKMPFISESLNYLYDVLGIDNPNKKLYYGVTEEINKILLASFMNGQYIKTLLSNFNSNKEVANYLNARHLTSFGNEGSISSFINKFPEIWENVLMEKYRKDEVNGELYTQSKEVQNLISRIKTMRINGSLFLGIERSGDISQDLEDERNRIAFNQLPLDIQSGIILYQLSKDGLTYQKNGLGKLIPQQTYEAYSLFAKRQYTKLKSWRNNFQAISSDYKLSTPVQNENGVRTHHAKYFNLTKLQKQLVIAASHLLPKGVTDYVSSNEEGKMIRITRPRATAYGKALATKLFVLNRWNQFEKKYKGVGVTSITVPVEGFVSGRIQSGISTNQFTYSVDDKPLMSVYDKIDDKEISVASLLLFGAGNMPMNDTLKRALTINDIFYQYGKDGRAQLEEEIIKGIKSRRFYAAYDLARAVTKQEYGKLPYSNTSQQLINWSSAEATLRKALNDTARERRLNLRLTQIQDYAALTFDGTEMPLYEFHKRANQILGQLLGDKKDEVTVKLFFDKLYSNQDLFPIQESDRGRQVKETDILVKIMQSQNNPISVTVAKPQVKDTELTEDEKALFEERMSQIDIVQKAAELKSVDLGVKLGNGKSMVEANDNGELEYKFVTSVKQVDGQEEQKALYGDDAKRVYEQQLSIVFRKLIAYRLLQGMENANTKEQIKAELLKMANANNITSGFYYSQFNQGMAYAEIINALIKKGVFDKTGTRFSGYKVDDNFFKTLLLDIVNANTFNAYDSYQTKNYVPAAGSVIGNYMPLIMGIENTYQFPVSNEIPKELSRNINYNLYSMYDRFRMLSGITSGKSPSELNVKLMNKVVSIMNDYDDSFLSANKEQDKNTAVEKFKKLLTTDLQEASKEISGDIKSKADILSVFDLSENSTDQEFEALLSTFATGMMTNNNTENLKEAQEAYDENKLFSIKQNRGMLYRMGYLIQFSNGVYARVIRESDYEKKKTDKGYEQTDNPKTVTLKVIKRHTKVKPNYQKELSELEKQDDVLNNTKRLIENFAKANGINIIVENNVMDAYMSVETRDNKPVYTIHLGNQHDSSTLIHEMAHIFIEKLRMENNEKYNEITTELLENEAFALFIDNQIHSQIIGMRGTDLEIRDWTDTLRRTEALAYYVQHLSLMQQQQLFENDATKLNVVNNRIAELGIEEFDKPVTPYLKIWSEQIIREMKSESSNYQFTVTNNEYLQNTYGVKQLYAKTESVLPPIHAGNFNTLFLSSTQAVDLQKESIISNEFASILNSSSSKKTYYLKKGNGFQAYDIARKEKETVEEYNKRMQSILDEAKKHLNLEINDESIKAFQDIEALYKDGAYSKEKMYKIFEALSIGFDHTSDKFKDIKNLQMQSVQNLFAKIGYNPSTDKTMTLNQYYQSRGLQMPSWLNKHKAMVIVHGGSTAKGSISIYSNGNTYLSNSRNTMGSEFGIKNHRMKSTPQDMNAVLHSMAIMDLKRKTIANQTQLSVRTVGAIQWKRSSVNDNNISHKVINYEMNDTLSFIKELDTLPSKTKSMIDGEMLKVINDKQLHNPELYELSLMERLKQYADSVGAMKEIDYDKQFKEFKLGLDKLQDAEEKGQDIADEQMEMLSLLRKRLNYLYFNRHQENETAFGKDAEALQITQMFMDILDKKRMGKLSDTKLDDLLNRWTETADRVDNRLRVIMMDVIDAALRKSKSELLPFVQENFNWVDTLNKQRNLLSYVTDQSEALFKPLFKTIKGIDKDGNLVDIKTMEIHYDENNEDTKAALNDPKSGLTMTMVTYGKWLTDKLQEEFENYVYERNKDIWRKEYVNQTPEEQEQSLRARAKTSAAIYRPASSRGLLPVIEGRYTESLSRGEFKQAAQQFFSNSVFQDSPFENYYQTDNTEQGNKYQRITSQFWTQFIAGNAPMGGNIRQQLLGISFNEEKNMYQIDDQSKQDKLSGNLENIGNYTIAASVRSRALQNPIKLLNVLQTHARLLKYQRGTNTEELSDAMDLYIKRNVYGELPELPHLSVMGTTINTDNLLGGAGQFINMTFLALSATGSVKNAISTAFKGTLNGIINSWTDSFSGTVDKLGMYTMNNVKKAVQILSQNPALASKINEKYQLAAMQERDLISHAKNVRTKRTAVDTDTSMIGNWLGEYYNTLIAALAQMDAEGTLDAHTLNSKGELEYDITKDSRFYKDGKKLPDADLLIQDIRTAQQKEGYHQVPASGINFAYSQGDEMRIKILIQRFVGEMNDNQLKSKSAAYALPRAFMSLRSYLYNVRQYWWAEQKENPLLGKRMVTEDKRVVWDTPIVEGVLQTFWGIGKTLAQAKSFTAKDWQNLSPYQKRNVVSVLTYSCLFVPALLLMKSLLDFDDKEEEQNSIQWLATVTLLNGMNEQMSYVNPYALYNDIANKPNVYAQQLGNMWDFTAATFLLPYQTVVKSTDTERPFLQSLGYNNKEIKQIIGDQKELSDVYTNWLYSLSKNIPYTATPRQITELVQRAYTDISESK